MRRTTLPLRQTLISAIPTIFTLDALPGTALPIYPGLGQAPDMLACIPGALSNLWIYKNDLAYCNAVIAMNFSVMLSTCLLLCVLMCLIKFRLN